MWLLTAWSTVLLDNCPNIQYNIDTYRIRNYNNNNNNNNNNKNVMKIPESLLANLHPDSDLRHLIFVNNKNVYLCLYIPKCVCGRHWGQVVGTVHGDRPELHRQTHAD